LNILAVGANPDDVELLCAGTLAKYSANGGKITICYMTTGDKGVIGGSAEEIRRVRCAEAKQAADLIGASVTCLDVPDGEVFLTSDLRHGLVDVIGGCKPDIIITHAPNDYMSDHRLTSQLVAEASFWGSVKGRFTVAPVYFMDTLAGIGFSPAEYVDISDTFDTKRRMLACHQSQVAFMKERNHIDFIEFMATMARFRGLQCGARYAEGFCRLDVWPTISTKRLLP